MVQEGWCHGSWLSGSLVPGHMDNLCCLLAWNSLHLCFFTASEKSLSFCSLCCCRGCPSVTILVGTNFRSAARLMQKMKEKVWATLVSYFEKTCSVCAAVFTTPPRGKQPKPVEYYSALKTVGIWRTSWSVNQTRHKWDPIYMKDLEQSNSWGQKDGGGQGQGKGIIV